MHDVVSLMNVALRVPQHRTPSEVCIQTACLDGDSALRQWQVLSPHINVPASEYGNVRNCAKTVTLIVVARTRLVE